MSLREDILEVLASGEPCSLADIKKKTGAKKIDVNRELYKLQEEGEVSRTNPGEARPIWRRLGAEAPPAAAASSEDRTLFLCDTGGFPNLYLPLASGVLADEDLVVVAPLDYNTNPKGVSESTKPQDRAIIDRAKETGRFISPRAREMLPEYADVMLAIHATQLLSRGGFETCVVVGNDKHNEALRKCIQEVFDVDCRKLSTERSVLEQLL